MTAIAMRDVMQDITLNVRITGQRAHAVRQWVAVRVIRLAAWILGTGIEISIGKGLEFDDLPLQPDGPDGLGTRRKMMVGGFVVPRSCSVDERSPIYHDSFHTWGQHLEIYLDGIKQDKVISYDIDAGYVRVYSQDAEGQLQVRGDTVESEIRRGRVELRPREAA